MHFVASLRYKLEKIETKKFKHSLNKNSPFSNKWLNLKA